MRLPPTFRAALPVWLLAFAWLLNGPRLAAAQEADPVFDAKGFQQTHDYYSPLPFEFVDTVNGNLVLTFTDFVLPGNAGFDLRFTRTYNSKSGSWTFGIAGIPLMVGPYAPERATDPEDPDMWVLPQLFTADGSNPETMWKNQIGLDQELITTQFWLYDFTDRSRPRLKMPNGLVATFVPVPDSIVAKLSEVADAFGNQVTFEWGPEGLTKVTQYLRTEDDMREVTFTYDGALFPHTMTSEGRTWTYEHDSTRPWELVTAVPPEGPAWQFQYGLNYLKVTTPYGGWVEYSFGTHYFERDQPRLPGLPLLIETGVLLSRTTGGPGIAGDHWDFVFENAPSKVDKLTISGPVNKVVHEASWSSGQLRPVSRKTLSSDGTNLLQQETLTYSSIYLGPGYEPEYHLPVIAGHTIQREGQTYSTTYSYRESSYGDYGSPSGIVETNGTDSRTTTVDYRHDFGPYVRAKVAGYSVEIGGESFSVSNTYNDSGFRTGETRYGISRTFVPSEHGNVAREIDGHGHETRYEYAFGVLESITTPEHSMVRDINADGTIASEWRAGHATAYLYDHLGRETRREPPEGLPIETSYGSDFVQTKRGASIVRTTLDGFGRTIATENSEGVKTRVQFDADGRKVYESDPFTSTETGTWFDYDALDRVTRERYADGHSRDYSYSGNQVTVTDENGRATVQTWQAFGSPDSRRLLSVRDALNLTTAYTYNALGKLKAVIHPRGNPRAWQYNSRNLLVFENHPESGSVTYSYDNAGLLTRREDGNGTTTYQYDGDHRLTFVDKRGSDYDTRFEYDAAGNRTVAANGLVSSEYQFDGANRLTERTETLQGYSLKTRLWYDGNDNLTGVDYPSMRQVSYDYDSAGRITAVRQDGALVADRFAYHPTGAVASFVAANGRTHSISYDARNRPAHLNAGGAYEVDYSYDGAGNVTGIDDRGPQDHDQSFAYDALDRLTSVGGFGSATYSYDALGNRTAHTIGSLGVTFDYDGSNRLTRYTEYTSPAHEFPFSYDAVGNATSDGTHSLFYTPDNQLEAVTGGGVSVVYEYDADGVRKVKRSSSSTRLYLHGTGLNVLSEFEIASGRLRLVRDYIYAGQRMLMSTDAVPGLPPRQPPTPPPPPGRFKSDGTYCYWDPYDSGPNQCTPNTGRYKVGPDGKCYWEPTDTGPNQCAPRHGAYRLDESSGQCVWDDATTLPANCTPPPAPSGRWKYDGAGNCYFETNDSGPNQCLPPPGRYKYDSEGKCVWDPMDDGPNQCGWPVREPAPGRYKWSGRYCYYDEQDDGPDQCYPGGPIPTDPPTVTLLSPANGASFTSPATILITAAASDPDGTIGRVEFYSGAVHIGTAIAPPYSFAWSGVGNGTYALSARAVDNLGGFATTPVAAISVNPPGVPPTVSLTAPANGASYIAPATVVFQASATDSDGSVVRVECLAEGTVVATDTSAPYACTWSGVGAGTYTLTARATDNSGLVTSSAAVSVTVRANTAPLVTVTSPPNGGSYYYPFVLTFAANAWDAEGNLSGVDFYVNNGHVGSDGSAPYAVEWGAPSSGTFAFTAIARDTQGASRSASVTIYIAPPTGRYKYDGAGQCYWEPNDSGPDQCTPAPPPGRWKYDGAGNCYWEPNDWPPDQCSPLAAAHVPPGGPVAPGGGLLVLGLAACGVVFGSRVRSARRRVVVAALLLATLGLARPAEAQPEYPPILTVERDHFQVNGIPKFLYFVSFHDGLREARLSPPQLDTDLTYVQTVLRADGIRVFPNWWRYEADDVENPDNLGAGTDTLFNPSDPANPLRADELRALKVLITEAAERGLIVDLTFTRESLAPVPSVAAYQAALVAIARELRPYGNVLFDLQNEFNVNGLTPAEVQALVRAVNAPDGDPWRVVTVSISGPTGGTPDPGYTPGQAGALASSAGLWVAAYHDARTADWYQAATITDIVTAIRAGTAASPMPVYLQEPTGWGTRATDDATTTHHKLAAVNAKAAGAAAWTFHQRVGFNLQDDSFQYRLGNDEALRTELLSVRSALDAVTWGVDPEDETDFYHLDAVGSVRAITNQDGTELERHEYFAFGAEWNAPATTVESRRFTGKERDAETGYDYFGARTYMARAGRFTTVDPLQEIEDASLDPQRWNRYAYVANRPTRFVDPDGRLIWALIDIGLTVNDVRETVQTFRDPNASGWDKTAATVGMVLGVGLPGAGYGKILKKLDDTPVGEIGERVAGFLSFTKRNARENLIRLAGEEVASQAHHLLPQKFAGRFLEAGININDPRLLSWWEKAGHLKNAKEWNREWEWFLRERKTREEILAFARDISARYPMK